MQWKDFLDDTKKLATQIKLDNYQPNILIAVARGGWMPCRALSSFLKVKHVASYGVKYQDQNRTRLITYSVPSLPKNVKHILLVEDQLETGKTLQWVANYYNNLNYNVKTAAVYLTKKTTWLPDYYVKKVTYDHKMPWEELPENMI